MACKKALEGGKSRKLHIWLGSTLMDYGASMKMEEA